MCVIVFILMWYIQIPLPLTGAYWGFFTGGGEIFKIYTYIARSALTTVRSAVPSSCAGPFPPRARFAPPPLIILQINALGKTHIKKWSEPLRKKRKNIYDKKENDWTSLNIIIINKKKMLVIIIVLVNIDQQKMLWIVFAKYLRISILK